MLVQLGMDPSQENVDKPNYNAQEVKSKRWICKLASMIFSVLQKSLLFPDKKA